ncbi:uncharacterized protein PgNI_02606 [Pyricularia grisea]|uniref:Uncharacterized protein n=1 Tax=Pyricularia grisea TaxID=148305 RepID=A0A6P8BHV6_PYRGI|nr:uncharacterized protein PgNI_02606 [Pyricularia grisea]TLD16310.1 hypothetical protein PgNI_02606 [Pyricularia grisea]
MTSDKLPFKKNKHRIVLIEKLNQRIQLKAETPRYDFMQNVIPKLNTPGGVTYNEMLIISSDLLMAGSETTATTLAGALYLLCRNPNAFASATDEVRNAFANPKDIDMTSTRYLVYLHGVVEETLRLFPPVPSTLPRITPPEGHLINGRFVPGDCRVLHFANANLFRPERWFPSGPGGKNKVKITRPSKYDGDRREAFKTFSIGPRNCIGKHLAYAEIRTILAKLLW